MIIINLKKKQLPQGWEICNLPNFTHIEMGQSPPSTTYNQEKVGLPFFQGKAEFTELYPEIEKYCSEPNKIAQVGATLLTVRAPVGPTNLANVKCCIGRGLAGIHPLGKIEPKFILFLMRSIESDISNKGTGSTFTAINKTFLEELRFALPPLNEQKRIVAKIEELFSKLDKGIENLKIAREQLKVYRQSMLKKAFEGKLTEKWREENADTLETAEELLGSIKKEREKHYNQQLQDWEKGVKQWEASGKVSKKTKKPRPIDISSNNHDMQLSALPQSWKWCKIADLISDLTDYHTNGSYEVLKENVELKDQNDYALMIRATCFEKNNFTDNQKYITEESYNFLSKSKLYGGEILIGKIGNAGKVYYMPDLNRAASLAMNLFCLRFTIISSKYIYMHLLASKSESEIKSYVKGVGNPTIDKISIRSLHIALPPLAEQQKIVEEIESKFSVIGEMEKDIEANLQKSKSLRQSILKKAFSGELVEQDPNDEPASVLLDRIRKEKEAHKSKQKKTKTKRKVA